MRKRNTQGGTKKRAAPALTTLFVAILPFAVFTTLFAVIAKDMVERESIRGRGASERVLSILLGGLRDHDDFGSVIQTNEQLKATVIGVGLYAEDGSTLYRWGQTPDTYQKTEPSRPGDFGRNYEENSDNNSIALIMGSNWVDPPPPTRRLGSQNGPFDPFMEPRPPMGANGTEMDNTRPMGSTPQQGQAQSSASRPPEHPFFAVLRKSSITYLEVRQPRYWLVRRMAFVLFPLAEILLANFLLFIRTLVLRNAEYRRRIEEQKNLVILGTAASTLAHEIKNPLLAIRLQTSILAKTCDDRVSRELEIINAEVERLSALTYRVNDFLRAPKGEPQTVDVGALAEEVSQQLCGKEIAQRSEPCPAFVDPVRLRSMLENLVSNALESGGPMEAVEVVVHRQDGKIVVDILDRGKGISDEDRARIFQPFFTTKGRGTGIGLAITKRFVEAANGSIELIDRSEGGTQARITLPEAQE